MTSTSPEKGSNSSHQATISLTFSHRGARCQQSLGSAVAQLIPDRKKYDTITPYYMDIANGSKGQQWHEGARKLHGVK